jgi:hypothetical protein
MSTTARAVLAAGRVSLSFWDTVAQTFSGFGDYFDADKFEIKPNFEELISESRSHLDYGQARASVIKPKPTEITIDLSAASVQAMAMQFQGLVQAFTQSSGTLTAQNVTLQGVGVWVSVGKRNLAEAGFSLTNSAGTTTYVRGTHYEVNWARGEIRPLAAAGAPAGTDVVKVTGTYAAVDGSKILGGRVSQVRVQARFDGENMVDGSPIEVDVWEAVLSAGSGFDFLGGGFTPISLSGKLVKPASKTEAYEVRFPAAAL